MIISMYLCLSTPCLPSAPCIVIHRRDTCVWAWWLHNSWGSLVVAASYPTPTHSHFHYSGFARRQGAQIEMRAADRQYQVPNTHVKQRERETLHTHPHISCRCVYRCIQRLCVRIVSVDIIKPDMTRDNCVCLPSTRLRKVRAVKGALKAYGKQTQLLSLIAPWCYAVMKLCWFCLPLPVHIIIICEPDILCLWEC